jgi:hypothetical protein
MESVKLLFKKSKDINKKTQYVIPPFSSLLSNESQEVVDTEKSKGKGKQLENERSELDEIDE